MANGQIKCYKVAKNMRLGGQIEMRFPGQIHAITHYYKQAMAIRSKYRPLKELSVLVTNYAAVLKVLKKNKEANVLLRKIGI